MIEFVDVHQPPLRGVSFAAPAGAVTVLIGTGKTTALRLACGLERPQHGAVIVGGRDVAGSARTRPNLGVVFGAGGEQAFGLFEAASVYENVAYAVRHAGRGSRRRRDAHVREQLERLGLSAHVDARPGELPVPLRRRAALARALALQAPYVLVDDLDAALWPLVRAEHRRRATTYLVATTDLDLARRAGDVVVALGHRDPPRR